MQVGTHTHTHTHTHTLLATLTCVSLWSCAGYGEGYTEIVMKGNFEDKKFLALYIKYVERKKIAAVVHKIHLQSENKWPDMDVFFSCREDRVIAAASLNFDPAVSAVAERLVSGKVITKEEAAYVRFVCSNSFIQVTKLFRGSWHFMLSC